MSVDANRAKEIFLDAMELEGAARDRFLLDACGDDPSLRGAVEQLLRANASAGLFMASPSTPAPSRFPGSEPPDETVGDQVGPYRLIRCLGEGGFGTVYLAEQTAPVSRRVAIKLLKHAVQSREVLARFEAERQALAMMEHPSIARVYDAGKSPRGRPYFVMEYVDGPTITRYADEHQLSIDERLDLMRQVCVAVQHAHQKGVIHRDLKPGNVIVATVDGRPVPKIIDFGIAKAAGERLTDRTLHTATHQILGTPQYMSPEQVAMSADVDTRSDVYSLGVILYELVTGRPPFDAEKLKSAGYAGLERIITEEEPPAPAARVADLGAEGGDIAARRATDPRGHLRQVRGEVEWVIQRAMRKQRHERYPTANALAEDIERLLTGLAVMANPVGRVYRLRKMASRYRWQIGAAAVFVLLLTTFAASASVLALRAERARRQAEQDATRATQISTFMKEILGGIDPAVARDKDTALLKSILESADLRVDGSEALAADPAAEVEVRNAIGFAYLSIGALDDARQQYQREVEVALRAFGSDHETTLAAESDLTGVLLQMARLDEAIPLLEDAVRRADALLGPTDRTTLVLVSNLANARLARDEFESAEPLFRRIYEYRLTTRGLDDPNTQLALNNLATAVCESGRMTEAERLFASLLEAQRRHDPGHPYTLATMNNLARVYHETGRTDEARALYLESLEAKKRILPPGHPSLLASFGNVGTFLMDAGDLEGAVTTYREALDGLPADASGPGNATLIRLQLSKALMRLERNAEAAALLREVLPDLIPLFGADHPHTLGTTSRFGLALARSGDAAAGLQHTTDALSRARLAFEAGDPRFVYLLNNQAEALRLLSRESEATAALEEAADLCAGGSEGASDECARTSELLAR